MWPKAGAGAGKSASAKVKARRRDFNRKGRVAQFPQTAGSGDAGQVSEDHYVVEIMLDGVEGSAAGDKSDLRLGEVTVVDLLGRKVVLGMVAGQTLEDLP